jgi:uncharacterized membrane protein YdjX (TVP38/TMEM64 family)
MSGSLVEKLRDHFGVRGNRYLIIITACEILYIIAYTLVYALYTAEDSGETINQLEIYKWAFALVLFLALVYFLWHSVINIDMAMSRYSLEERKH